MLRHHHPSVYSKVEDLDGPCVLFQDYNGYWAPLSELFYSTSSKVLVSRHPESAIEEVVSHYCPQCLAKYSDEDVHKFSNRCPSCMQCPCCESLLTGEFRPMGEEGQSNMKCSLICANCSWSSLSSGVAGDNEQELSSIVLDFENKNNSKNAFLALLEAATTHSIRSSKKKQSLTNQTILDIDEDQVKKMEMIKSYDPKEESLLYGYVTQKGLLASSKERNLKNMANILACADETQLSTFDQRWRGEYLRSNFADCSVAHMIPHRIYLRTKKMIRCRCDVKGGKMSILMQPKNFPLEGDSSHKLHQGKWFLKDSSAHHHMPRITISKLPIFTKDSTSRLYSGFLHVEISNGKDNDVVAVISQRNMHSSDDSDTEAHPPFSSNIKTLRLSVPDISPPHILLKGYEDELLRDDADRPEQLDFSNEDSTNWGVLNDGHLTKLCIPVTYTDCNEDQDSAVLRFAEVLFSMKVADLTSQVFDAQDGESISCELDQNGIQVQFRVAFRL